MCQTRGMEVRVEDEKTLSQARLLDDRTRS